MVTQSYTELKIATFLCVSPVIPLCNTKNIQCHLEVESNARIPNAASSMFFPKEIIPSS